MPKGIRLKRVGKDRWSARVYIGRDLNKRVIRPQKTFRARDEDDAMDQAVAWRDSLTSGGRVRSTALSSLLERRIQAMEAAGASPNSVRTYRLYAGYARRFFGTRSAGDIDAVDVSNFTFWLLTKGRARGGGLSPTTAAGAFSFVRSSYRWLVGEHLVSYNPTLDVEKPRPEAHEALALSEADLHALIRYLDAVLSEGTDVHERCAAFGIWQALRTGMRCGEVCAVRPRDVFISRLYVHVGGNVVAVRGREPERRERAKTARSHRNISISEDDAEGYRSHMEWARAAIPGFSSSSSLVGADGRFMSPDALSAAFRGVRDGLGLDPHATFHTLRHTHASWCLAEGVDLVTLSERMGHASPSTTARIYGHMIVGRDRAAAEAFTALMDRIRGES